MKTKTEAEVLKALGIPDFRHMTKDKIVTFASELSKMDPEVAKKALEQFPSFKEYATDLTVQYKEIAIKAMESNSAEFNMFAEQCKSITDALTEELKRDDITSNDRARIEDNLIKVAQMLKDEMEKSRRFKKWVIAAFSFIGTVGLAALAAALGSSSKVDSDLPRLDDIDDTPDPSSGDIIDGEGEYISEQ